MAQMASHLDATNSTDRLLASPSTGSPSTSAPAPMALKLPLFGSPRIGTLFYASLRPTLIASTRIVPSTRAHALKRSSMIYTKA